MSRSGNNRRILIAVIGAFVAALIVGYLTLFAETSGIMPGDDGVPDDGAAMEAGPGGSEQGAP
ncbi:hypothetical protein [Arsenicitalea aurantiaca]|uniref:hypothetical protein n=1 Tax=Arsenicitalea aurantiaca TaxID=1783274 RepID=UPI001315386F|nr:hypothetical protein [Arsenicitalea aurantiaca]